MNISAVLRELGMPTIRGYKPKYNIQKAIFGAIERYLSANPSDAANNPVLPFVGVADAPSLFRGAAARAVFGAPTQTGSPLQRLIRKFDPSERDYRNLRPREQRARRSSSISNVAGSNSPRGGTSPRRCAGWRRRTATAPAMTFSRSTRAARERLIEVKTTCGPQRTPFFLTRNERSFADERPDAFRIYRVYEFGEAPRFFKLRPPLHQAVVLEPETFRASFDRADPLRRIIFSEVRTSVCSLKEGRRRDGNERRRHNDAGRGQGYDAMVLKVPPEFY